ncbi:MAG: TonB-dependent receptor, partial [Clostridia bacterium]|nr:TonB-dependent receptor [Clostridia bacterium]
GFTGSSTGLYKDGVFAAGGSFGGRTFSKLDLFDIERFEALRGPQGALFGRQAMGGAVNLVTQRPLDEFSGYGRFGWNDAGRYSGEGVVNTPINDGLRTRIGAIYETVEDGFRDNSLDNGSPLDDSEFFGLRAAAELDVTPRITANLTFEYLYERGPSFGSIFTRQAYIDAAGGDRFAIPNNSESEFEKNEYTGTLTLTGDFDDIQVSSVTMYRDRNGDRVDDFDAFLGIGAGTRDVINEESGRFERITHETRVSYDNGGPLRFLIGGDIISSDDAVITNAFGLPPVTFNVDTVFEDFSWSIFGSLSYDLTDNLEASVELRYTRDKFSVVDERTGAGAYAQRDLENTDDHVNPVATLTYTPIDGMSLYARYATAYRPIGFNRNVPVSDPMNIPVFIPFEAEDGRSYEVGVKTTPLDNVQFNLTAFYFRVDDVQLISRTIPDNQVFIQNIGDSETYGLELELRSNWDVGPGELDFNAALTAMDGEYLDGAQFFTNVAGTPTAESLAGIMVARVRDYSANINVAYTTPLTEKLYGQIAANYVTESGGLEEPGLSAASLPSYDIIDLKAAVLTDRWRVEGFVKNLTNEIYAQETLNTGQILFNTPRVFGVQASVSF